MDLYGLIGYPLEHSFSQSFFSKKFSDENIDAEYHEFEIPAIGDFLSVVKGNQNLKGLNVTMPYKTQVIQYLDGLDQEAEEVGAVNVIKFVRSEGELKLIGYNSDVVGFHQSIAPLINKQVHKQALILGTGGASKAVLKGLQNLAIDAIYVSRVAKEGQLTYTDLDKKVLGEYKIVINASPLGTYPNIDSSPDIPYQYLTDKHLLFDLVYNPEETKFLRQVREQGAVVKNGLEMLHLQALEAWRIWCE